MSTLSQSDTDPTLQQTLALLLKRAEKACRVDLSESFLHVTKMEANESFEQETKKAFHSVLKV